MTSQANGKVPLFSETCNYESNPFHFPEPDPIGLERHLATTCDRHGHVWSAVRTEQGKSAGGIQVVRLSGTSPAQTFRLADDQGASLRPVLTAAPDDGVYVAWSVCAGGSWSLKCARLTDTQAAPQTWTVWSSAQAINHPSACWHDGVLWLAWSGENEDDGRRAIFLASGMPDAQAAPVRVIAGPYQAFRPSLATNGRQLLVAADISHDGVMEIVTCLLDDTLQPARTVVLGRAGQRWLSPTVTGGTDGLFHLAFTVVQDVIDPEYGIIDHDVGAAYCVIEQGQPRLVPDERLGDGVLAARLREGLLGRACYVAYFGRRRQVMPVVLDDGRVWLTWEYRYEDDADRPGPVKVAAGRFSSQHYGYLAGRQLSGSTWGPTQLLHEGGTLYSLPARQIAEPLVAVSVDQSDLAEVPALSLASLPAQPAGRLAEHPAAGWARWQPLEQRVVPGERQTVDRAEGTYNLYWADTHVHSFLSPDAEGEPDEELLCARDIASLDAVAIIDNDYYPHKPLSQGEWAMSQDLARLYTQPGSFVVFSGYEYTYHDPSLQPDFNHRYVLYPPGSGGLYRRIDKGSQTVSQLADKVASDGGIMVAHHPTWVLSGAACDQFVEINSSWRVCMEEKSFIRDRLAAGDRFAFIGSSDTHRAVPGQGGALTGLYAKDLTPESLLDAYRQRRTIVTQGLRPLLILTINDIFIGGEGQVSGSPEICIKVQADRLIVFVDLIRDGEIARTIRGEGPTLETRFIDEAAGIGPHVYYLRLQLTGDPSCNELDGQMDDYSRAFISDRGAYRHNFARAAGPLAWTSPIWINRTE